MAARLANKFTEVIFIGLPGPTHNYGGLSSDNVAATSNQGNVSRPADAAMQVVALARLLMSMGLTVALLPPQLRPYLPELRKHFSGRDENVIAQAREQNPALLEAMSSSSAMWVANAATITPPQDTTDGKLHITIANLHTNLHRRIEAQDTYRVFHEIFADVPNTVVNMPLDAEAGFRDEGAANHTRLAPSHSALGLHVFVYGTDDNPRDPKSARQTLATSQEIANLHHMADDAAIFVKQNPLAINQGVFHNDVIAVGNESMLLVHEEAYVLGSADINYIAESYAARTGQALTVRTITRDELSLDEAIDTYFFNSQLITLPKGGMALIAPSDVKDLYDGKAWKLMEKLVAEKNNPISEIRSIDLRQSMRNGGGPACLRLRVLMNETQLEALTKQKRVIANERILRGLEEAIRRTYPDTFHASYLNHQTYLRCREALQAIGICLGLELLSA